MARALAASVPLLALALSRGCGPAVQPPTPRERAVEQVFLVCERLHQLRVPDGWHARAASPGEVDEWDVPLRVEYVRGLTINPAVWFEEVIVSGTGPDGVFGTLDDVRRHRMLCRPAPSPEVP
jgi:hypothetical protein